MKKISSDILSTLLDSYKREEFPALLHQMETWGKSKPLLGLSILDASPLFLNTFAKYAALLEAGASLTIGISSALPPSRKAIALAESLGIPMITQATSQEGFDIVLDCAGEFRHTPSRLGYVELTRSGVHLYETIHVPVWAVDSGSIKQIETTLGTGDGFIRAMKQLGHTEWRNKKLIVFGYGKVGKGIVLRACMEGSSVIVVDFPAKQNEIPSKVEFISLGNPSAIQTALINAFCAVTATGIPNAIQDLIDAEQLITAPVLLANMGVEDEWGGNIPASRVLNGKKALNFILRDPTRMCYIDPALALHNAGAIELATHRAPKGISAPSSKLENEYIQLIRERGIIREEMDIIGLHSQEP